MATMLKKIDQDKRKFPLLLVSFKEWLIKYGNCDEKMRKKMKCSNRIIYDYNNEKNYYKSILDFIAGMTDNFAIKVYNEIISF